MPYSFMKLIAEMMQVAIARAEDDCRLELDSAEKERKYQTVLQYRKAYTDFSNIKWKL